MSSEEFIPSVTSPNCTSCCIVARSDWLHPVVSIRDVLQDRSDWPNKSCESQRHDHDGLLAH